jgi:quercetin dioxygenase-like cupin family protein
MTSPSSSAGQPGVRHADAAGFLDALEGIKRKTLLDGGRTQIVEFKLARGTVIPLHDHPQEQTGYLVSGRMTLTIGGVDHALKPGDAWTIPGGVAHGAKIAKDSVAIEVFSPPRPDYRLPVG